MAYVKNIWVDQDVERPKTYEVTNNQDGSITLTDSFGLVTELGTPVNAVNMNHIEDGLADTDLTKYNATTTYNTGEWVTGVVDNKKGIYTSKINNNIGNALSNNTYWEKVFDIDDLNGKADVDLANVNNSGTSRGASWAMPSNTYIDLTLGASGSTYTAPANGWFAISSSNGSLWARNYANNLSFNSGLVSGFSGGSLFIPCIKNSNVVIAYNGAIDSFRFIYAQGSESEAS